MSNPVKPELIAMQGEQLQNLDLSPARCDELAVEVGNYNRAVSQAAADLEFDHEPADFGKALLSLRAGSEDA